jgi:hypothetical protein
MTLRNLGLRIGCALLASAVLVGCARSGRNAQGAQSRRSVQTGMARQQQQPQRPVNVVTAAADIAGAAVGAVTGAVNGAVNGAVAGANGGAQPQSQRRGPRIKPNGRGGYDASELQQDAIRRAHAMSDRYGTIDRSRPDGRPATRPSNR